MKLSRKPAGLSAKDEIVFYASKYSIIQRELNNLASHWGKCTEGNTKVIDGITVDVTCRSAGVRLCCTCVSNGNVYAEKRKLKSQLSKASDKLTRVASIRIMDISCDKAEETLTDRLDELKGF